MPADMLSELPAASEVTSQIDIALAEVLHQAPALFQLLPTLAWKSLLCTSSALRQANRSHVQTLRVPWPLEVSERAIQLLVSGNWISLEVLDLSFTDLDAAGMKQLQNANWPKLQQLNVAGTQLCQEAIKQLSRGQWPDLEIVQLGHIDSYGLLSLQYLDNSNWPLLKSLQLPHVLRWQDWPRDHGPSLSIWTSVSTASQDMRLCILLVVIGCTLRH